MNVDATTTSDGATETTAADEVHSAEHEVGHTGLDHDSGLEVGHHDHGADHLTDSKYIVIALALAVITAADVPGKRNQGLITDDWRQLVAVGETTRYVGDVLAAVAAETRAQARAAAQLAASRADAQVTLVVDRIGVDWRLRVQTDLDGVVNSELVGAHNTSIQASSGAASGTIDATTPLIVQFDHAGNLSSVRIGAGAGSAAAGVAMVLSGDSSREACIYPTGYVADAGCE